MCKPHVIEVVEEAACGGVVVVAGGVPPLAGGETENAWLGEPIAGDGENAVEEAGRQPNDVFHVSYRW